MALTSVRLCTCYSVPCYGYSGYFFTYIGEKQHSVSVQEVHDALCHLLGGNFRGVVDGYVGQTSEMHLAHHNLSKYVRMNTIE